MSIAYVDTSCIVAIALREPGFESLLRRIRGFDLRVAANLLAAEYASAMMREQLEHDASLLHSIEWIHPSRALDPEIGRVLDLGYVRGADCWHLACALSFAHDPGDVHFVTLDTRQATVARALGFKP